MNPPTPAIVAQSAVRRLPRAALWLFCLVYVLPGFLGRDPWRNADMQGFGVMAEIARGASTWWQPTLLGQAPEFDALIPYWLGAAAIRLFSDALGWLSPEMAVRLPFMALLGLTLASTWYAVYHLARSPRAQPVAFAFGGEADPRDYACALADAGLLGLIACLGLAQFSHETTPSLAQLAFAALTFYGLAAEARAADGQALLRRLRGPLALALGLAGLALSGAPMLALLLALGGALAWQLDARGSRSGGGTLRRSFDAPDDANDTGGPEAARRKAALVLAAALGVAVLATALGLWQWRLGAELGLGSAARLLLWFTWPVGPLALWAAWRWRRQLSSRHLMLPLWCAGLPLVSALSTATPDRSLLLALPALAALAAFTLPTLRRSVSALIDWFTLLFFSGGALIIWAVWLSLETGVPRAPAANVARLAPGFSHAFSWPGFLAALAATAVWFWLVHWRVGRHRAALWKSLVLPAGGAALCWLLLMTLWLPALDYARSYRPMVAAVQRAITGPGCVEAVNLSTGHIAALRHHAALDLVRVGSATDAPGPDETSASAAAPEAIAQSPAAGPRCPWRVQARAINASLTEGARPVWRLVATVRRPADAKDQLLVYRRERQ